MGSFGKNLKAELLYQNMLVKTLVDKTGIKRSTIDNYLTRGKIPSVTFAVKIAHALGVSVESLVDDKEPETNRNGDIGAIAKIAVQLPEQKQKTALTFLRWLRENEIA